MFYYFNSEMKWKEPPLPTFETATDAELATILAKHYNDEIDLSTLEGWEVGATRKVHMSALQYPDPYSSSGSLDETDITLVIIDHEHNDLATPINGHSKAGITVETRECLGSCSSYNGQDGTIYINGDSGIDPSFTKWSNLYMRTYLNDKVFGAFPSTFRTLFKQSKHYKHTTYDGTEAEQVTDTIFLPSYAEVFGPGSQSYYGYIEANPTEGTQFEYYQTQSNRIKYGNNNGSLGKAAVWWSSSPSSAYGSSQGHFWIAVSSGGYPAKDMGNRAYALAPAFCM